MPDKRWTLFDGRAGDDSAQVWLEPAGYGSALATLAHALVVDRPELDPTMSPIETLAAAFRGDSAATSRARQRLDELSLAYGFTLR